MKWRPIVIAAVGLLVGGATAPAQTANPAVQVEQPWARASAGAAKNGAAYMNLRNTGTAPDRLVAVASPVAGKAELHTTVDDRGVMRMRAVDAVDVKPGEPVALQPGGVHIMLIDLKAPLREGEDFPLTLSFERSGSVQVMVRVATPGAMAPSDRTGHSTHDPPPHKSH